MEVLVVDAANRRLLPAAAHCVAVCAAADGALLPRAAAAVASWLAHDARLLPDARALGVESARWLLAGAYGTAPRSGDYPHHVLEELCAAMDKDKQLIPECGELVGYKARGRYLLHERPDEHPMVDRFDPREFPADVAALAVFHGLYKKKALATAKGAITKQHNRHARVPAELARAQLDDVRRAREALAAPAATPAALDAYAAGGF
jgi:hypothetical protein